MKKILLSDTDNERIKEAVKQAESKTSGEIVTAIIPESSDYAFHELLASIVGAIPYLVSGAIPNVVDALFESTSGFTTTGASILPDIEAVPAAILFWRSMTQWLGGIGIVVLFVALLSELGPGARFLFKLEVPGPKAEIFHTHVRETAVAPVSRRLTPALAGLPKIEVWRR